MLSTSPNSKYRFPTRTGSHPLVPDIEGLKRREPLEGPGEGSCPVGAEVIAPARRRDTGG
jgi:hypothetical protein